jgi:hypothetical protein
MVRHRGAGVAVGPAVERAPGAGVQFGFGVGVDMNVSTTGAGVGQERCTPATRMCAPETRHPPLDPVSFDPLQAATADMSRSVTSPAPINRIDSIVAARGKRNPPAEGRGD